MTEDDTRRELDRVWARLEAMDANGTRGVGIVQSQLADLMRDVAKLESRMEAHDRQHAQDNRDRAAGRRWVVGTAIAFAVLLVAIITLILSQHGA